MNDENSSGVSSDPKNPKPTQPKQRSIRWGSQYLKQATGGLQNPVSASQMGLSTKSTTVDELRTLVKKFFIPAVLLIVIIVGFLAYKKLFTGLDSKNVSNGGYNYTFRFYKSAGLVQLSD